MSASPETTQPDPECKECGGQGWYAKWTSGGGPPDQIQCADCFGTGAENKHTHRCGWCGKTGTSEKCPHCENHATDFTKPHDAHWSRRTAHTVECKTCLRVLTYEDAYQPGAYRCEGVKL